MQTESEFDRRRLKRAGYSDDAIDSYSEAFIRIIFRGLVLDARKDPIPIRG
jgi:hypothetical protein